MDAALLLQEYLKSRRDSKREQELMREIRRRPKLERFELVMSTLPRHLFIGMDMAVSCLRGKEYFERLFVWGLDHSDASSIRVWLQWLMPSPGARRVIFILKNEIGRRPKVVYWAVYWLPSLIGKNQKDRAALRELIELSKTISR